MRIFFINYIEDTSDFHSHRYNEMANSLEELLIILEEKIKVGENLISKLQPIQHIDGVMKLQRKIRQEVEFLKKLQNSKKVKIEQLACSNLRHLGAMVDCALRPGVISVCKIFHISNESKMVVDVISNEGKIWTKVIARNPKSLSALSSGKASYGARSVLDQAEDYLKCAQLYLCMYQPPKVVFEFVSGIEESLANKLQVAGVVVKAEILPDSNMTEDFNDSWESESSEEESFHKNESNSNSLDEITDRKPLLSSHVSLATLNLDVTAMMAFVSNMTNGRCHLRFPQEVLTQQAAWEAQRPVKCVLEKLFEGKTLVCCETAWDNFEKIVNTLGGPMEKKRTAELKQRLTIYPDDYGGEDDYPRQNLKVRGHVRLRSKTVFNFGHRIKALTVSANEGFVRAAKQQGVTYAAFVHESRALTEGKEECARKISL